MKKLFAALCGLLSVTAAQACNWNAENCTFEMLNNIQRQIANLKQNPKFMQEKFAELQAKAQYIDRKTASCSNWKCSNDTMSEFNTYVAQLTLNYGIANKPAVAPAPAPAPVQDKWSGQCVIAAKSGVVAYVDQSASNKAAGLNENQAYSVTQANGGKYVGLATVPDYSKPNPDAGAGKFVGWVKKSDLQMQDLRNCN